MTATSPPAAGRPAVSSNQASRPRPPVGWAAPPLVVGARAGLWLGLQLGLAGLLLVVGAAAAGQALNEVRAGGWSIWRWSTWAPWGSSCGCASARAAATAGWAPTTV